MLLMLLFGTTEVMPCYGTYKIPLPRGSFSSLSSRALLQDRFWENALTRLLNGIGFGHADRQIADAADYADPFCYADGSARVQQVKEI